jgi:predicted XRE-type DNA-binding protein
MSKTKRAKNHTAKSAAELGELLGLTPAQTAEMEFRSDLTVAIAKAIQASNMTHAQIAEAAGTSRTRVTAIANANTDGISTDVLIRVLAAMGFVAKITLKKSA